jgi:aldehyde:ferredoxin oxidoreductase
MPGGYADRVLHIDLTSGKYDVRRIKAADKESYLGGRGLAAQILFEEMPAGVDPLGPENKLLFFTGPLTGTRIPFTPKHVVVTKSPLTGGYTRSISGGYFSPELKFAGYDGIVISGKSPHPVSLLITDEKVEIKDATSLWGLTVPETERSIQRELGNPSVRIASIGPAGEKLVRFASILNDTYRVAGRGGTGAVMGSKNLKAIAVSGRQPVTPANPELLQKTLAQAYQAIVTHPGYISRLRYGAMETVPIVYRYGIASVRHYSNERFTKMASLDPLRISEEFVAEDRSCFACPHRCLKYTAIKTGRWTNTRAEGPKYETVCMFGPNCDNDDLASIVKANEICASYGMDSASTGNVIAFAMECAEKGILKRQDTGGVPVRFGSGECVVEMVRCIATRQGLGDLLAEGVKRAAATLGKEAEGLAMHVKGQELGSFDPRGYPAMGLAYATSNRGACHMGPPFRLDPWWHKKDPDSPERWATTGKANVVVSTQNLYVLLDSLMFCSFSRYGLDPNLYMTFLSAVTGMDLTWEKANLIANGIYSVERIFNLREGFTSKDDMLPQRFLEGPGGLPLRDMLAEYYALRGWDQAGIPPEARTRLPSLSR